MTSGSGVSEQDFSAMLDNPNFIQQMNEMLNNDAFIQMMESHPAFRGNPAALRAFRSPEFRRMMLNPETLRSAARMQNMMRGGGANAFPMPGATDNGPGDANSASGNDAGNNSASAGAGANAGAAGQFNPFDPQMLANLQQAYGGAGGAGGAGAAGANPFAGLFSPFSPFGQAGQGAGAQGAGATQTGDGASQGGNAGQAPATGAPNAQANPFASLFGDLGGANQGAAGAGNPFGLPPLSPEALQQMLQTMGMGSPSGSPAPADNRPPEERYAEQLRQLNDMGFYDFDRNVAALRRSGGSVQGAIEHLLNS
jgi:ubiquilin